MRYYRGEWVEDDEPQVDEIRIAKQLMAIAGAEAAAIDRVCVDSDAALLYPRRKRRYHFTPPTSARRVVERSRPRDAGPTLRHYWKQSQENLQDEAYRNGYRARSMEPAPPTTRIAVSYRVRWVERDALGDDRGRAEHYATIEFAEKAAEKLRKIAGVKDIVIRPEY